MKNNSVYRETYRNYIITIEPDNNQPESPRDWSANFGTMACWHRHYKLGDVQPRNDPEDYIRELLYEVPDLENNPMYVEWAKQVEETWGHELFDICIEQWLDNNTTEEDLNKLFSEYFIHLPLYLYDHGGITMSTSSFSCPWDSGQVGFIFVSKEKAKKEFEGDDEWEKKAIRSLVAEVNTYDDYLTGNIYGFCIYEMPEEDYEDEDELDFRYVDAVESCWGFYADHEQRVREYNTCLNEARSLVNWMVQNEINQKWEQFAQQESEK